MSELRNDHQHTTHRVVPWGLEIGNSVHCKLVKSPVWWFLEIVDNYGISVRLRGRLLSPSPKAESNEDRRRFVPWDT
jgi:hypothetical protein